MHYSNQQAFRRKAIGALAAIFLFILVYLALIVAAAGLTALCVYAGLWLIVHHFSGISLLAGIGIIGISVLVLVFLFKFLFNKQVTDRSGMQEITEEEAPELFALVREIADTVHTSFPGHIYLTAEVNASVFYDSSLASLLFPVKKNLQIGLGLVNSVTESEFKAILAHEFGHFSQKSMKLGSYVYQVNRIIYNLLYENDSFRLLLARWTEFSSYFALFAQVSVRMVQGIQWIMGKVYHLVNIHYLGLSREMEFHADEIAAFVAGSGPMISGLMRLEFADTAYNNVISFYNEQVAECRYSENIYPQHSIVMGELAGTFDIPVVHGLAAITDDINKKFNRSRLTIRDQWASHPPVAERVARIAALGYTGSLDTGRAWNYFRNAEQYQQRLTKQLFSSVSYKQSPEALDDAAFTILYGIGFHCYDLHPVYKGFYDSREITDMGPNPVPAATLTTDIHMLFNEEHTGIMYEHKGLSNDIALLEQIAAGKTGIRQFDYNGHKYKSRQASDLLEELKVQQQQLQQRLEEIDRQAFVFFAGCAGQSGELQQLYRDYAAARQQNISDETLQDEIIADTAFMQVTTTHAQITHNFEALKPKERQLKERLRTAMEDTQLMAYLDKESIRLLDQYTARDWNYFKLDRYLEDGVQLLSNAIRSFHVIRFCSVFRAKKAVLDFQASLVLSSEKERTA